MGNQNQNAAKAKAEAAKKAAEAEAKAAAEAKADPGPAIPPPTPGEAEVKKPDNWDDAQKPLEHRQAGESEGPDLPATAPDGAEEKLLNAEMKIDQLVAENKKLEKALMKTEPPTIADCLEGAIEQLEPKVELEKAVVKDGTTNLFSALSILQKQVIVLVNDGLKKIKK